MRARTLKGLLVAGLGFAVGVLSGCANMEYVPNGQYFFYHKELPAAARAVEAARSAGKDKECPAAFQAAAKLKDEAYALYYACHTQEAIAKANEAIARLGELCPKVAEAPKAPPAPAPSAPTISLSADSASLEQGACTNLTWSTANASSASIDQGIGSVQPSGSRQVCPESTTRYTLTAAGAGGSRTESTTVNVVPKPPAPIDRLTVHVNFDTNKSQVRKDDLAELRKAAAFVTEVPRQQDLRGGLHRFPGQRGVQPDSVRKASGGGEDVSPGKRRHERGQDHEQGIRRVQPHWRQRHRQGPRGKS